MNLRVNRTETAKNSQRKKKTTKTHNAWFAPCPKCGLVGCAASPSSTHRPANHCSACNSGLSKSPNLSMRSVVAMSSGTGLHQEENFSPSSVLAAASSSELYRCQDSGEGVVEGRVRAQLECVGEIR